MRVIIALVAALALCGVASAQSGPPGLLTALEEKLSGFEAAFAKQSSSAAAAFFTSYGVFLSADNYPFVGTPGVEAALQGLMDEGTIAMDLSLMTGTVITSDPLMSYATASYVKHSQTSVTDTGFTSFVFVSVAGEGWQVAVASSTSNRTSSAGPTPAAELLRMAAKDVVVPHSNQATIMAAQAFFNQFQGVFNAGSMTAMAPLLAKDVSVFTKDNPEVSGVDGVIALLGALREEKYYSVVSTVVVEAGSHPSDLYYYARGAMTFFDANGMILSSNNFVSLVTGSATSSTPELVSLSVVPTGNF